jgi:hypothetical protein
LLERRTMLSIAAPARTIGFFMILFSFAEFGSLGDAYPVGWGVVCRLSP